jgi:hypothetical protein
LIFTAVAEGMDRRNNPRTTHRHRAIRPFRAVALTGAAAAAVLLTATPAHAQTGTPPEPLIPGLPLPGLDGLPLPGLDGLPGLEGLPLTVGVDSATDATGQTNTTITAGPVAVEVGGDSLDDLGVKLDVADVAGSSEIPAGLGVAHNEAGTNVCANATDLSRCESMGTGLSALLSQLTGRQTTASLSGPTSGLSTLSACANISLTSGLRCSTPTSVDPVDPVPPADPDNPVQPTDPDDPSTDGSPAAGGDDDGIMTFAPAADRVQSARGQSTGNLAFTGATVGGLVAIGVASSAAGVGLTRLRRLVASRVEGAEEAPVTV